MIRSCIKRAVVSNKPSISAAGQVTTLTYNARGQALTVTNANNEVTSFTYNANGYLTGVDGPLPGTGDTTSFTYDANGRPRTVTGPDGYALTYDYDAFDRVTKITYPDATYEAFTYNRLDRVSRRDRLARITTFEYNGLRQLVKTTDPANRSVAFDWCKCGDMKSLTDPLGRTTRWVHDVQGRVTAKQYADGSKINYLYEPQTSRLAQRIDEKNQTTLYSYNLDDTLRSVSYPDAPIATPTVSYAYDSLFNRIASMTDGIGTTNYSYLPITGSAAQGAGQLASVDGPWSNDTITYTYDKLGRPTNRSINGTAETAVFDAAGRPSSVTNPLGTFTYAYVPNTFRLASVSHSAGMSTVFSYLGNAQDRRLSRIRNLKPGGTTPISTFDYTYDAEGRIQNWTQQNDTATAQTWELSYDSADQLAAAVVKQGATTLKSSAWEYDTASNRTKETINSVASSFSYNTLNELTNASTTLTPATYEWDAENRLTAVNQGTARTEFAYDGLGRRVKITEKTNGTITSAVTYLWCGLQICERRDAAGTTVQQRYYAQGFQGVSGTPTGIHLYTFDHLGSIRELVDTAGTIKERISYDAWGQPSFSNATPLTSFAFTGHFWHGRSGLHLAPYRAYAAGQGRWISRDPAEEMDSFNLFSYVGSNSVNYFDPTGEFALPLWGAVALAGGIIGAVSDGYEAYSNGCGLSDIVSASLVGGVKGAGSALIGLISPWKKLNLLGKIGTSIGLGFAQGGYSSAVAFTFGGDWDWNTVLVGGITGPISLISKYVPGLSTIGRKPSWGSSNWGANSWRLLGQKTVSTLNKKGAKYLGSSILGEGNKCGCTQ
jgi:RHS repeat-associated protein